ncbi:MAG TPA: hypothetical protein DEB10_07715 [Ruminococcaceae bacterium]|nr:hypothetical protein [Clostridiales bacterium]HBT64528.1 hypothetical protein [Oscillospiraceae bacterium]
MVRDERAIGENVLRQWTDSFLLKDMNPLEKRLFDWWIGEGFFCASNFKQTEKGIAAQLMLLLGGSIYQVLGHENDVAENRAAVQISDKVAKGWRLLESGCNGYFLVEDSKDNRANVKRLLSENIRNFDIVEFTSKKTDNMTYLKSVTVDIHRKREMSDATPE